MNKFNFICDFKDKIEEQNYDHTDLYFYYCYLIEVPKRVIINFEPHKSLVVSFCINRKITNIYCFYVMQKMSQITVKSNLTKKEYKKIKIYEFLMKSEDSYVFGKTKVFTNIDQIISQQYKEYKLLGNDTLSTIYFMKLISNKIIYHKYFSATGLMKNTEIISLEKYQNTNYFDRKFLKAPYSSATYCSSMKKLLPRCFIDEGVIVQTINEMLSKVELKCKVIDGEIVLINVKSVKYNALGCFSIDIKKNSFDCVSAKAPVSEFIEPLLTKHINGIRQFAKKCFIEANILLNIYGYVKNLELKLIKKYKLNEELFFSDMTQKKLNELNQNPTKFCDYIELLNKPLYEYRDKFEKSKIIERFMRIDIMLPDDINYLDLSLIEIEPFASGHGLIDNNLICVDIPDHMQLIEKTSTALMLMRIFENKNIEIVKLVKKYEITTV